MMLTVAIGNVIFAVKFFNFSVCTLGITGLCGHSWALHLIALVTALPFCLISSIGFFTISSQIAAAIILGTGKIFND